MKVFVSHSKRDIELVNSIFKVLHRANLKPFIAEFEELGEIGKFTAAELRKEILESKMLILLLTKNVVASPYTRNWVAYEVGVAHGSGIPIWVFEDENNPVSKFPIPHVDYYFLYDPKLNRDWGKIEQVLKEQGALKPIDAAVIGGLIGTILGGPSAGIILGLLGAAVTSKPPEDKQSPFIKIENFQCPKCRSKYTIIGKKSTLTREFLCPVCRTGLSLQL